MLKKYSSKYVKEGRRFTLFNFLYFHSIFEPS